MMRNPALVAKTMRLLTDNLSVPVTAKIRSGWEGNRNYLEIGRILQDNGCAAIAIHPAQRTEIWRFGRLGCHCRTKADSQHPVIGNGDITSAADIDRMLDQTGVTPS